MQGFSLSFPCILFLPFLLDVYCTIDYCYIATTTLGIELFTENRWDNDNRWNSLEDVVYGLHSLLSSNDCKLRGGPIITPS